MKDIINHPVFKAISISVLFVFSSLCLFQGTNLGLSFIGGAAKGFLLFLPAIITLAIPSFSLIIYFMYWHVFNVKRKWRILHLYTVVVGLVSIACFILNFVFFYNGSINDLFQESILPTECLGINLFFFISTISTGTFVIKYHHVRKVSRKFSKKISALRLVLSSISLIFASFFFGDTLSAFNLIGKPYDIYFPLMLSVFFVFLYGTAEITLFAIYKNIQDSDKKFTFYKNSLFYFFVIYLFNNTIEVASVMIDPDIFTVSMNDFLPFQRFLGFPLEIILATGLPLIPIIIACIRFGRLKNEQKQKENASKK